MHLAKGKGLTMMNGKVVSTSEQESIRIHPRMCIYCRTQSIGPLGHLKITCVNDNFTLDRNLILDINNKKPFPLLNSCHLSKGSKSKCTGEINRSTEKEKTLSTFIWCL